MKSLVLATVAAAAAFAALPAAAQDGWGVGADVGLGASHAPDYLGSEDMDTSPWVIFRNIDVVRPGQSLTADGSADGLAILPSLNYRGDREADDSDSLAGLDDIDASGEVGLRLKYSMGDAVGYIAARRGFGGHEGVVGEFGAKYRFKPSERLTMWAGAEADFANEEFVDTYFGISPAESITSGYVPYSPDGGIYAQSLSLEGRYALTDSLALLGEARYTKLTGDAADSPIVEDETQPSVRLGIVHRFNFRF